MSCQMLHPDSLSFQLRIVANPFSQHRRDMIKEAGLPEEICIEANETDDLDILMDGLDLEEPVKASPAFPCSMCSEVYKQHHWLVKPMRSKHSVVLPNKVFLCDIAECCKTFDTLKKLNRHKKSHK